MQRRHALQGLAAILFAAAVKPGTALALGESDADRLARLLAAGKPIVGMEFRFYNGEAITQSLGSASSVILRKCRFMWFGKWPEKTFHSDANLDTLEVTHCTFDMTGCDPVDIFNRPGWRVPDAYQLSSGPNYYGRPA